MLGQVQLEDSDITEFPQALIDAVGSVEEINQSCVVFSAYAGNNAALCEEYTIQGEQLISEIQEKFPRAAGQERNIVDHIERIPGFLSDDDLVRYDYKQS